jgi:hypothetical protein
MQVASSEWCWAPDGRQRSKTFERRIDAERWLAQASVSLTRGEWTDPARARMTVGDGVSNGYKRRRQR